VIYREVENPKCVFCVFATPLTGTEDMLCKKCGVVSENHVCKKFKYDVRKRKIHPKIRIETNRFHAEDFEI